MDHGLPLITTLATALALALVLGFVANRLKLPTIVGYLVAGILIGPYTPFFTANAEIAAELAEIGVMLLMFGVGLQFSVEHLIQTKAIVLPGALIQIAVATILGFGLASWWGWPMGGALVFGIALSVASTVVLIRALESFNLVKSINGQIAIGWLIVEDLAMVLVLVFLPILSGWLGNTTASPDGSFWLTLAFTLFKMASFIAIMLLIGKWVFPKLLWHIAKTGSRELFTLCIIAAALGIAFGASRIFGMSFALGAFFAGLIIRESNFGWRAAQESLTFREAFAVLFFVAVGMLFDPLIFIQQPLQVLAVVGIIIIGKSLAAAALVLAFRYPLNTALTVSASLAQIGEFSFILAGLGMQLKLLPIEGQGLIVAGALISIALNPFVFKAIEPLQNWLRKKSAWVRKFERSEDKLVELPISTEAKYLSGQAILAGYGIIGKKIAKMLLAHRVPIVVIDENRDLVEELREDRIVAVFGDASEEETLIKAHVAKASMLIIAITGTFDVRKMITIAEKLNPHIDLVIQVENEAEAESLEEDDIKGKFFSSEDALAKGMGNYILQKYQR